MARKDVIDLSYLTGYGTAPSNGTGKPFLSNPIIEPDVMRVLDVTASAPAALGKLLVLQSTVANLPSGQSAAGAAYFAQNATANIEVPEYDRGIVSMKGFAQLLNYAQADIVVRGPVQALCVTGVTAIAAGNLLVADASGNLTYPAVLAAPSAQTAVPGGTTGAATVTYLLYARNQLGRDSVASGAATSSTSNATLSNTNYNLVTATIPTGTYQVVVSRTVGGASQGIIAVVNVQPTQTAFNFVDYGVAAGPAYAAPTVDQPLTPGIVLATAMGALAASQAATLVPVCMGSM